MASTVEIPSRVATRPTWAEVSLANLRQNFRTVVKHAGPGVTVCAVVKADAYGHGAVECSRALQSEGAKWLGVTSLDEAIPLRDADIESRILLMTGFWRGEETEIVRQHLTPTVWEPWHFEFLEAAAARANVRHAVHLKVDTGMGRLGVSLEELPAVLEAIRAAPHLVLEGLSTHLASSEIMDAPSVAEQSRRFEEAQRMVRAAGFDPELVHMANTSALISRHETWNKMVRPGIALYGYYLPFQRAGREVSGGTLRLGVSSRSSPGKRKFSRCETSPRIKLSATAELMSRKRLRTLLFCPLDTLTDTTASYRIAAASSSAITMPPSSAASQWISR